MHSSVHCLCTLPMLGRHLYFFPEKKEMLMARLENLKIVPFSNFLLSYVIYTIQDFFSVITIAFYVLAQFTSRFISNLIPETFQHENDLRK